MPHPSVPFVIDARCPVPAASGPRGLVLHPSATHADVELAVNLYLRGVANRTDEPPPDESTLARMIDEVFSRLPLAK